jgi:isoquinoline 1-oxidoreductase subunit beta
MMTDQATAKPAKATGLTRRRLLAGGGIGVGLLVGYALWPSTPKLDLPLREDERLLNGWLKIGTDGRIVVIVPQAEMGQGVFTALPMIIADELGASWGQVAVEPAPLHATYMNSGLFLGELEESSMPGMIKTVVRWGATKVLEVLNLQLTGASSSVRGYAQTLRLAGAAAREMLCKAAAKRWQVDWTACQTRDGFVIMGDKSIGFGELAEAAALEVPSDTPALRPDDDRRIVGQNVARLDIPSKVDGSVQFGLDVRIPDLVYAAIEVGPANGAKLLTLDEAPARETAGVLDVVKGADWYAVVASSWWVANEAVKQLTATFARDGLDTLNSNAIDAALLDGLDRPEARSYEEIGDVSALATERSAIQADYTVPYLAHACLEPMNATVRINGDTVDVWAPTQSATVAAINVAQALDLPRDAVRVYPTFLGGGFGRKAEGDACRQAAIIAKQVGKPVQLIWSREVDTRHDKFRPGAAARFRASLSADGKIAAWSARLASDSLTYSFMSRLYPRLARPEPDRAAVEGVVGMPYSVPSVKVEHAYVPIGIPLGYWRAVGHSFSAFYVESFMDELAAAAKADPVAFRLRHLGQSPRHAAVLQAVAERADWNKPLRRKDGIKRGRGIALHESFKSIVAQVVEVSWSEKQGLTIDRVVCGIDCGSVIHPDTVVGQMEGSIIFALTAALKGRITFDGGEALEQNFDAYPLLTLPETPDIEVFLLPSGAPLGGVGEPGVPPLAPALANAIFNATGQRLRALPLQIPVASSAA